MFCKINKPIVYTRARDLLMETLQSRNRFKSVRSLRSVGATAAAGKNASERLIEIHERWKTAYSKDNYFKDSVDNLFD